MNTKKMVLSSILLAIGLMLHYIIPGTFGAMKPDTLLSMMFIALLICDDYKSTVAIGLAAGVLTALTTTFPGGQIPNFIDKIVTAHIVYFIIVITRKVQHHLRMFIISTLGTLASGTVFLLSAMLIVSLPMPFKVLFAGVVLPAMVANTVLAIFIYSIVSASVGRSASNASKKI